MRLRVGQGVVGAAVEEGRPILVNDIRQEPRYMGPLRNMLSQLAVPMRRKGRVIGALNLLNTYWAVVFPQVPSVIALFVFKQFFDGIPKELEESARLDGASNWRIYRSIIMPLSKPVLSAMAIVTFVGVWNNLILPLFTLSNPKLMTIPVGLATVQGSFGQRYADIQASTILGALPLVILFLIFQRRIVEGVAGTGLKG
jgi:multiple sugar transport system permease protein